MNKKNVCSYLSSYVFFKSMGQLAQTEHPGFPLRIVVERSAGSIRPQLGWLHYAANEMALYARKFTAGHDNGTRFAEWGCHGGRWASELVVDEAFCRALSAHLNSSAR